MEAGKPAKKILLCLLAAFLCYSFQQQPKFPQDIQFIDGKQYLPRIAKSYKASVFVFLSPECPLCQNYTLTLNSLYKQFKSSGITFYAVFPGTHYTVQEIKDFQKKYRLEFGILLDPRYRLKKYMKATVTPEVFVYDPEHRLIYSGRIDNWAYAPGKHRKSVTEHDLRNALVSVQKNVLILNKRTQPVGCLIE